MNTAHPNLKPRTAQEILSESEAFFMIAALELPLELGEQLDKSVRNEYKRLWETLRQARK